MREQLNNNPAVQAAVVGVLLVAGAIFLMTTMGGGGEEAGNGETATTVSVGGEAGTAPSLETSMEAPTGNATVPELPPGAAASATPPPAPVLRAFRDNQTVVLLFIRDGGIDDKFVADATARLDALPNVATFVVQAKEIARYASIAQGVAVDRVPALVVLRPKKLNRRFAVASVSYGFQSQQSVGQAVIDAGYKGRTLDYHP